jgi:hypothetical protein
MISISSRLSCSGAAVGHVEVSVIGDGERVFGISDVTDQLPPDPGTALQRLAEDFARYLRTHRIRIDLRPAMIRPVVTFAHEPAPAESMVTLGHLVTVTAPLARLLELPLGSEECVIWEHLVSVDFPIWLGGPLPAAGPPHPHRLLVLKRAVREQSLPDTPAGRALGEVLASGRYLSARLAYQYPELIRAALGDLDLSTWPNFTPDHQLKNINPTRTTHDKEDDEHH